MSQELEDDWSTVNPRDRQPEVPAQEPPPLPPPAPKPRSRMRIYAAGIVVTLLLVGGVIGRYYTQAENDARRERALITEGRHHDKALQAAKDFAQAHRINPMGFTCGWEPKDGWVACTLSYQDDPRVERGPRFKKLKCPAADRDELECADDGGY